MSSFSLELQQEITAFRHEVINSSVGVLDPVGVHHQFNSGMHGQKLDFDKIKEETVLYDQWVKVFAKSIIERYPVLPNALLGVANGTNRLAVDIGKIINVAGLETIKNDDRKTVRLSDEAREKIKDMGGFIVVIEDVGTTGRTTLSAVNDLGDLVERVEVAHTWVRTDSLPELDKAEVVYWAMIHEQLPTFTPEDCANLPEGLCKQGYELIGH